MDDDKAIELNLNGESFIAHRNNTTLFTFLGELSTLDHVFIQTGEEDEHQVMGSYIFSTSSAFDALKRFLQSNQYPQHLNMNHVPDCDREAWVRCNEARMQGHPSIPEDDTIVEHPNEDGTFGLPEPPTYDLTPRLENDIAFLGYLLDNLDADEIIAELSAPEPPRALPGDWT